MSRDHSKKLPEHPAEDLPGRPFDITEPAESEAAEPAESEGEVSHDGDVNYWDPIPRLRDLLHKLFPSRLDL